MARKKKQPAPDPLEAKKSSPVLPDISWLEASENPWQVRLLDVRPLTLTVLSSSTDQRCALNAVSFGQDDGTSFIGDEPPESRISEACLRFPIDRVLADGMLFTPSEMEHKWALFYHRGHIICVRSWLRKVQVVARVEQQQDYVEITQVHGTFGIDDEEPELTIRVLDYLLRSHALDSVYPAPLPVGMEKDPNAAAMWCMSMFGNRASFATPAHIAWHIPDRPLRTHSLLHIAVARGDAPAIEGFLAAVYPLICLPVTALRRFIGLWRAITGPSWRSFSIGEHRLMCDRVRVPQP